MRTPPSSACDIGAPVVTLTQGDFRVTLKAARVSSGYFSVLGAKMAIGRTFSSQENNPSGPPVAVIGNGLWHRSFGHDPAIVGRTILLEQVRHKVIGVLAPGFVMDPPANIWLPLQADPASADHISRVRVIPDSSRALPLRRRGMTWRIPCRS